MIIVDRDDDVGLPRGHIHQAAISERHEFEVIGPEGRRAVVVSTAPGFGQPRPNRRGEARGLHVYDVADGTLGVETYIWRDDDWALTARRTYPRGREPLSRERALAEGWAQVQLIPAPTQAQLLWRAASQWLARLAGRRRLGTAFAG